MATKNLARTAIEGGRCSYYKMEVASRYAEERAGVRTFLVEARRDPETAEDRAPPKRRPVRACFSDKLEPVYRYLDAQCGRPWNKVRGELFARFDIRTTPGRHVLFDHVLGDVNEHPDAPPSRYRSPKWYVDRHGILRRAKIVAWPRRPRPRRLEPFLRVRVLRWLGDRRVAPCGERFVWQEADHGGRPVAAFFRGGALVYLICDASGEPLREPIHYRGRTRHPGEPTDREVPAWRFRPTGLLTREEERSLAELSAAARDAVLDR